MTRSELVAALDAYGNPLPYSVRRSDAHRLGIWHRSISVFAINRYGEILIERRSESKDLFPGYYDIPGGHLQPGQHPAESAARETKEELSIDAPASRFEPLTPEDGLIERVVLPEHGIVNLERKTVYLLKLTEAEELTIHRLASKVLRLTAQQLDERGASGEVSRIEFWSWERLASLAFATGTRPLASGTLSAVGDELVRRAVVEACMQIRRSLRHDFKIAYPFLVDGYLDDATYDRALIGRLTEQPAVAARAEDVTSIFENGASQLPGAYSMSAFRQVAEGDDYWESKLRDTESRYVRNLLSAAGFGQPTVVRDRLDQLSPKIQTYVADLLNLPLATGERFRDRLGNLTDIAVGRRAVMIWLAQADLSLARDPFATGPVKGVSLRAGRSLLLKTHQLPQQPLARIRDMLLAGLGAAAADFNNPNFQGQLKGHSPGVDRVMRFVQDSTALQLSPALGGEQFLSEFYDKYIEPGERVSIAYLAGNAAQAYITIAIVEELLRQNPHAAVHLVTKEGSPGNDLTLDDVRQILVTDGAALFPDLLEFQSDGRFVLVEDGPRCHGLDPANLSDAVARALARADVIVAEGQAYAEIRGWKKPAYIVFRVNGRVAEAIHGLPRELGGSGFVRLTPGVDHFDDFLAVISRTISSGSDGGCIPAAAQTTREYVRAILSENLSLLTHHIFRRDAAEACARIRAEAARLGKTFATVLTGAGSEPPDKITLERAAQEQPFPVFGCGGGGGFNGVTLRALRALQMPVVAGVPSTDDGGSTGALQRSLRRERGFVFGVGDMAAILQDALVDGKRGVLAFRFDEEPDSLPTAVAERLAAEMAQPTYAASPVGAAEDFLSFCCDQLNLARVIQRAFKDAGRPWRIAIKGASIRNLNVIAAYELCGMLGAAASARDPGRRAAFFVLRKALGIPDDLMTVPVTYDECVLTVDYETPISEAEASAVGLPDSALSHDRTRVYGQHHIDILMHRGRRLRVDVVCRAGDSRRPAANPEYLKRLREAKLFVMGAGSLIGSQLSQLVVPGVVDVLLSRVDMRRVLVLNHVKMDETLDMSVRDQVQLIETVASDHVSPEILASVRPGERLLRISDLFTDIVLPRTVAREIEAEMAASAWQAGRKATGDPRDVEVSFNDERRTMRLFPNGYVQFLLERPDVRAKYAVTARELEVLSYLDQPRTLHGHRTEGGRYRGALFATPADIEYLERQGIQRRSIHEVDSIGQNSKFVKVAGTPKLEFFPGLVPEALLGIFRIALERASTSWGERIDGTPESQRAERRAEAGAPRSHVAQSRPSIE